MSDQGSIAWLMERCGKVTASRFNDVVAKTKKGEPTAGRETYKWELAIERITQTPSDHWTSAAMLWGTDCQQAGGMAFEAHTGLLLEPCGFVVHPQHDFVGASPDGLIGDNGGYEMKAPYNSRYHLQTFIDGMPPEHVAQVQGGMWVTGREWWRFMSFDPRMPEELRFYIEICERDDAYIAELEREVLAFNDEVNALVGRLQNV